MSADQYKLYKLLARYRTSTIDPGRMWPEGLPLPYVNSGLYAIHKWETREVTCPNCKQEVPALQLNSLEVCVTCTGKILTEILEGLKNELGR